MMIEGPARQDKPAYGGALRTAILLILTAGIAFMAGVLFAARLDSRHNNKDFQMFWQSWDILEREFYYDLPDDKAMVYGAIQGLVSTVRDPYTFFQPPRAAELDRQEMAGEFGGIGADVHLNAEGQLVIVTPFPGLPAAQAGIQPDDVILEVDGVSIAGWSLTDILARLRGEIGTPISLTLYRPSTDTRFSVDLVRAKIELPTVYARTYGEVGYVRLFSFNSNATEALREEISRLLDQNVRALIVDLRGNPGGYLDEAVSVSDLFLGESVVVKERARDGQETVFYADNGDLAEQIPLVVLIDGGSASASEVVAGALHDQERALLIGQTSYGKGSVQHVHDLPDRSQLHVTVALWFTPDETPIQEHGLTPDIAVQEGAKTRYVDDPFIDTALQYFVDQYEVQVAESQKETDG